MLVYHRTSILESRAQTVVNTVNCVGVMGKGLAAAFKKRYPAMFSEYSRICGAGELSPGGIWVWHAPEQLILNFATKDHWRSSSRIEWIERGLRLFRNEYDRMGIYEASFPRLGCGNGGLDWEAVRPLMEQYLADLPIDVFIHDYEADIGLPEHVELMPTSQSMDGMSSSLEDFVDLIKRVSESRAGRFFGIETREPFLVRQAGSSLVLNTEGGAIELHEDDLRSIWAAALSGMVTRDNLVAGRAVDVDFLLGMVSALPHTRVIQIQRPGSTRPEIAVETRRRRRVSDFSSDGQCDSWLAAPI